MYEYSPPPPINVLVTALIISNTTQAYLSRNWRESGKLVPTKYKFLQILRTLQGYIFRIVYFATKLRYFTHFKMLFLTVPMDFIFFAWVKI